jgi:hypothetical protein
MNQSARALPLPWWKTSDRADEQPLVTAVTLQLHEHRLLLPRGLPVPGRQVCRLPVIRAYNNQSIKKRNGIYF